MLSPISELVDPYLPAVFTAIAFTVAFSTSIHVILSRREPGSSIAWIALVWLAPVLGVLAYLAFGINRIHKRAASLRADEYHYMSTPEVEPVAPPQLPVQAAHLQPLMPLVQEVVDRPLLPGNRLTPLFDGDEAYPAMIDAIDNAEQSITFVTYIFDNDAWGKRFVEAFARARKRGVTVKVLVDAAGLRYSFPTVMGALKRADVDCARFLPSLLPPSIMTINLRNHRKIMVVDGELGFTGGINIRHYHVIQDEPNHPTKDLHFRVEGPVVAHLQEIFVDDWAFTTGEPLRGEKWFPPLEPRGDTLARGIPDGPDEHIDKLNWTIQGAISTARDCIRIVTPYFIPNPALVAALGIASLRGVTVDIVLPGVNNLPYVQWASRAHLRPLLERGVRIHHTPAPFDHTKLMIVDRVWYLCGSANIDPRSLRLNFEFNLECWDPKQAAELDDRIQARINTATPFTLQDYQSRSPWMKLRDGAAALLSPYL